MQTIYVGTKAMNTDEQNKEKKEKLATDFLFVTTFGNPHFIPVVVSQNAVVTNGNEIFKTIMLPHILMI